MIRRILLPVLVGTIAVVGILAVLAGATDEIVRADPAFFNDPFLKMIVAVTFGFEVVGVLLLLGVAMLFRKLAAPRYPAMVALCFVGAVIGGMLVLPFSESAFEAFVFGAPLGLGSTIIWASFNLDFVSGKPS